MKKSLLILPIIILISLPYLTAQPSWIWARGQGDSQIDQALAVASDNAGNIFITGGYRSQVLTFGSTTLTNSSNTGTVEDFFVAKYDANGNVLWAKTAGGYMADQGWGITTDILGNVYVSGTFESSFITFGSVTINGVYGMQHMFVVKYDPNGNVVWAKGAASSRNYSTCISYGSNQRIYVAGYFAGSTLTMGAQTLSNTGTAEDIYVAELDTAGNVIWLKGVGGNQDDEAYAVTCDMNGNVFVGGYFMSSSLTHGTTTLTNGGYQDAIIAQFDVNGNAGWALGAGSSNDECIRSLATDGSGNLYSTGMFRSSMITLGSNTLLNGSGGNDKLIIMQQSNSGAINWAQTTTDSTNGLTSGVGIATNTMGDVFVGVAGFGNTLAQGTPAQIGASGGTTIYRLTASGLPLEAIHAGEDPWGICATPNEGVSVAGRFYQPSTSFGPYTLNNFTTNGSCDLFVAKFGFLEGIDDPDNSMVRIFPNPGNGIFNFEIPNGYDQVEVFDIAGRKMVSDSFSSTIEHIDLSPYSSGTYIIRISGEKGVITKKILLNK